MYNNFAGAPTAGSHDYAASNEELHARIRQLEERIKSDEAKERSEERSLKGKKIKWKKVRKFFNAFIKPILIFIPNLLNAIAGCEKAFTPA